MAENAATVTEQITVSIMARFSKPGPGSFLPDIIGEVAYMKTSVNALLLAAGLAVLPVPDAFAAGILKFEPKAGTTMREALVDLKKERVSLTLESGEQVEGTVTMVGDSVVYITQLSGKVLFDAVVSIDKISAITFRKQF